LPDPVNAICLCVETVIAKFASDKQHNEDTACNADSQSQRINSGVCLVAQQVS